MDARKIPEAICMNSSGVCAGDVGMEVKRPTKIMMDAGFTISSMNVEQDTASEDGSTVSALSEEGGCDQRILQPIQRRITVPMRISTKRTYGDIAAMTVTPIAPKTP